MVINPWQSCYEACNILRCGYDQKKLQCQLEVQSRRITQHMLNSYRPTLGAVGKTF